MWSIDSIPFDPFPWPQPTLHIVSKRDWSGRGGGAIVRVVVVDGVERIRRTVDDEVVVAGAQNGGGFKQRK